MAQNDKVVSLVNLSAWEKLLAEPNDYKGNYDRFSRWHVVNLYTELTRAHGKPQPEMRHANTSENAHLTASFIRGYWTETQVETAHTAVWRGYGTGKYQRFDKSKKKTNTETSWQERDKNEPRPDMGADLDIRDEIKTDKDWLDKVKAEHLLGHFPEEQPEDKTDDTDCKSVRMPGAPKSTLQPETRDMVEYVTRPELKAVAKNLADTMAANHQEQSKALVAAADMIGALDDKVNELINAKPLRIEIIKPDKTVHLLPGLFHQQFPHLLAAASTRENIWVWGPAGTGKSTAGEQLAHALFGDATKFYCNNKMVDQHEVTGYQDGHGVYHTTNFRRAFEGGGIYMSDEIDRTDNRVTTVFNGALEQGRFAFPDKDVMRHPDFIFIATANTSGAGGNKKYVGAMKHDAAFLDRFWTLDWPIDLALEDALTPNKAWLQYVRDCRAKLGDSIEGHMITPRASIKGSKLLAAGMHPDLVIEGLLKKGLSASQWQQIKPTYKFVNDNAQKTEAA